MWYERRPHLDGSEGSSSKVSVKDGRPGSRARWGTNGVQKPGANPKTRQSASSAMSRAPPCSVRRLLTRTCGTACGSCCAFYQRTPFPCRSYPS